MIVINVDCLKENKPFCSMTKNMVRTFIKPVPNSAKFTLAPTQAIYWFSKDEISKHDLQILDLPTIGANFGKDKTLLDYLKWMLEDINKHAIKTGMGSFTQFKETTVITDADFEEIKKLGARVVKVGGM